MFSYNTTLHDIIAVSIITYMLWYGDIVYFSYILCIFSSLNSFKSGVINIYIKQNKWFTNTYINSHPSGKKRCSMRTLNKK